MPLSLRAIITFYFILLIALASHANGIARRARRYAAYLPSSASQTGARTNNNNNVNNGTNATTTTNECRCSDEKIFSEALRSGVFKSPGFPNEYCDLLHCIWSIQPGDGTFVSVTLDFFETEPQHDVLEVYQTRWNGSNLLMAKQASLSGTFDPRIMERHFFSSLGGGLLFRFITDHSEHDHPGFQLSFQRHNKDDHINAPCPMPFHYVSGGDHTRSLPILAAHFRTDSSCIFMLNSTQAIRMTVNRFAIGVLSMRVYETENFLLHRRNFDSANQLAKIQTFVPPLPFVITSRTNSVTVLIASSTGYHTVSQTIGPGTPYDIQFESTKSVCECFPVQLVVSRSQPLLLNSPGFPLEYCDRLNCSTRISLEQPTMPPANDHVEVLRLRFGTFQTEPGMDTLTLMSASPNAMGNAGAGNAQLLIELSDRAKGIQHFTIDASQFELNFATDRSIVEIGFNASVEVVRKAKDCTCPNGNLMVLDGHSATQQFHFNAERCRFMDCFWQIQAPMDPAQHRLLFRINHTLADPNEFIEVFQGMHFARNPFGLRIDATDAPRRILEFDNSFFRTTRDGPTPVRIWYHREWPDDQPVEGGERVVDFSYEWRESCVCGPSILQASISRWQPLRSPDYPQTYCRSMRCQWQLEAPDGHHLLLNITAFNTEADQDFLTLFDGNDITKRLSGIDRFDDLVRSKQNVMTLVFITDSSIQMSGFEIWFKAASNAELSGTGKMRENPDDDGHTSSKLFWLCVFLMFALGGTIFLLLRSNNTICNYGQWPFTWTGGNGTSAVGGIPGYVEGRVRFVRHHWPSALRRAGATSEEQQDLTTADVNIHQQQYSANNPLFAFR